MSPWIVVLGSRFGYVALDMLLWRCCFGCVAPSGPPWACRIGVSLSRCVEHGQTVIMRPRVARVMDFLLLDRSSGSKSRWIKSLWDGLSRM